MKEGLFREMPFGTTKILMATQGRILDKQTLLRIISFTNFNAQFFIL